MPSTTGPAFPRAFLAGNTRLVIWNKGGQTLAVHDVSTGRQLSSWSEPDLGGERVEISPNGRWCLIQLTNRTVRLRERSTGQAVETVPMLWWRGGLAFSPDGNQLAIAYSSGSIRRWDLPSLTELQPLRGFLLSPHSVAFSPDGRRLAVGSAADKSLKFWDLESEQPMLTLPGEGGTCLTTAFSPDGSTLVTRHENGMLDVWRVPSWEEIATAGAKEKTESQQP